MATTEQRTIYQYDERMDKLRIRRGQVQAAPLSSPRPDDAESASNIVAANSQVSESTPDAAGTMLSPDLRRNFIIPPKERAMECIAAWLNLARSNLGTSQRNLHAARRGEDEKSLSHWKWESLHWLRRCGKWSNHKRKVEAR